MFTNWQFETFIQTFIPELPVLDVKKATQGIKNIL